MPAHTSSEHAARIPTHLVALLGRQLAMRPCNLLSCPCHHESWTRGSQ